MSWLDRWQDPPEKRADAAAALRDRVRRLTRKVEPARDLWPGVARRIAAAPEPRPRAAERAFPAFRTLPGWALGVATAMLLVVTTALATLSRLSRLARGSPARAAKAVR